MKTYRVFLARYYIAVEWFDVVAETQRRAQGKAQRAARKLRPDPRLEATDNGWLPDDPVEVRKVGSHGVNAIYPMREVVKDVFQVILEPDDCPCPCHQSVTKD